MKKNNVSPPLVTFSRSFMKLAFFLVRMSTIPYNYMTSCILSLFFSSGKLELTTYTFRFFGLKMKSSSSWRMTILFLAFVSPLFFQGCCCGLCEEELSGLKDELVDLIGVPILICFCFLCFFSYAFFARSGDNKPCSIILHQEYNIRKRIAVHQGHWLNHLSRIKLGVFWCIMPRRSTECLISSSIYMILEPAP